MSLMYEFVRIQWQMGKIDTTKVDKFVSKGLITADEGEEIKSLEVITK